MTALLLCCGSDKQQEHHIRLPRRCWPDVVRSKFHFGLPVQLFHGAAYKHERAMAPLNIRRKTNATERYTRRACIFRYNGRICRHLSPLCQLNGAYLGTSGETTCDMILILGLRTFEETRHWCRVDDRRHPLTVVLLSINNIFQSCPSTRKHAWPH